MGEYLYIGHDRTKGFTVRFIGLRSAIILTLGTSGWNHVGQEIHDIEPYTSTSTWKLISALDIEKITEELTNTH